MVSDDESGSFSPIEVVRMDSSDDEIPYESCPDWAFRWKRLFTFRSIYGVHALSGILMKRQVTLRKR